MTGTAVQGPNPARRRHSLAFCVACEGAATTLPPGVSQRQALLTGNMGRTALEPRQGGFMQKIPAIGKVKNNAEGREYAGLRRTPASHASDSDKAARDKCDPARRRKQTDEALAPASFRRH